MQVLKTKHFIRTIVVSNDRTEFEEANVRRELIGTGNWKVPGMMGSAMSDSVYQTVLPETFSTF